MLQLNFSNFPVLATKRLLLKQITTTHVSDLFYLRSHPQVMQYIDRPKPTSDADIVTLIEKMDEMRGRQEGISWGIHAKNEPEKHIGNIGLFQIKKEHYRAEIGYMLHPAYQRQGLMQECMKAIIDFGFNEMKLHSIEANINPLNVASAMLLVKNGFVREGYFKENYYCNGQFSDSAIYSLLEPNWVAIQ